jgi:metal-sulfur cluster biosynthetic enzyme
VTEEKREDAAAVPNPAAPAAEGTHPGDAAPVNAAPADPSAPNPAAPAAEGAAAPTQQEMAVRSALETVMDPEIGLSVIDLGLIRTVTVGPVRTHIEMLLTTPFCPYAPQMLADVKAAAMSVVEQETQVDILPDAWNPQMMPDPGLLGFSY